MLEQRHGKDPRGKGRNTAKTSKLSSFERVDWVYGESPSAMIRRTTYGLTVVVYREEPEQAPSRYGRRSGNAAKCPVVRFKPADMG